MLVADERESATKRLVGYIVSDASYVESVLGGTDEEGKRLQKWRKTFDLMQLGKEAGSAPLAFNIAGWNSSYTRQPIPAEEMREWVIETVREIKSLGPSEVLEIGCGTGLLLLRIAPDCRRYVATDFSPVVLQSLREQIAKFSTPLPSVTVLERPADNFEGFAPASFDTIIINSVIQYFPALSYLIRVLEGLLEVVKPGGKIMIGDVRSLPLLETSAASIELFQAPPGMNLFELRERVQRRVQRQMELTLSPAFFLALQKRFSKISRVVVRPKRGRFDNELTSFRFTAVLHIGAGPDQPIETNWVDWPPGGMFAEAVQAILEKPDCETLALRGVSNARVEKDLAAAKEIAKGDAARTAGELRHALGAEPSRAIAPHRFWEMAEQAGFLFDWSWLNAGNDGCFDMFFKRLGLGSASSAAVSWPQPAYVSDDLTEHANALGQTMPKEKLLQSLREFSKQTFPRDMIPSEFVLVDTIPTGSKLSRP
jgi:SAM-dependent methyltransferase